jgi:hypothetical protein
LASVLREAYTRVTKAVTPKKKNKKTMMMMKTKEIGYREHNNKTSVFIMCCSTSWADEQQMASQISASCNYYANCCIFP